MRKQKKILKSRYDIAVDLLSILAFTLPDKRRNDKSGLTTMERFESFLIIFASTKNLGVRENAYELNVKGCIRLGLDFDVLITDEISFVDENNISPRPKILIKEIVDSILAEHDKLLKVDPVKVDPENKIKKSISDKMSENMMNLLNNFKGFSKWSYN